MIKEMKVLQRTIEFCKQHPLVDKEIDEIGANEGIGHDEYARFTMAYEPEHAYPELFKYLKNCGIGKEEMILVEFD